MTGGAHQGPRDNGMFVTKEGSTNFVASVRGIVMTASVLVLLCPWSGMLKQCPTARHTLTHPPSWRSPRTRSAPQTSTSSTSSTAHTCSGHGHACAYSVRLYGRQPDDERCRYRHTIAGPSFTCRDASLEPMFRTAVAHVGDATLGLGRDRHVVRISVKEASER